jgi:hypothetical protein
MTRIGHNRIFGDAEIQELREAVQKHQAKHEEISFWTIKRFLVEIWRKNYNEVLVCSNSTVHRAIDRAEVSYRHTEFKRRPKKEIEEGEKQKFLAEVRRHKQRLDLVWNMGESSIANTPLASCLVQPKPR